MNKYWGKYYAESAWWEWEVYATHVFWGCRMDDHNPEDWEIELAPIHDRHWLNIQWGGHVWWVCLTQSDPSPGVASMQVRIAKRSLN